MKCYVHRDVDAIGVCASCGQGICDSCAVRIAGRLYCKSDADKVYGATKVEAPRAAPTRGPAITVAAILFYFFGILGVIGGLFVIVGGALIGNILGGIPLIGGFGGLVAGVLIVIGFVTLIISALEVLAGEWLWKSLKKGGALGIILLIFSILALS